MKTDHHLSLSSSYGVWLVSLSLTLASCQAEPTPPRLEMTPAAEEREIEGAPRPSAPAAAAPDPTDEISERAEALVRHAMEQAAAEADGQGEASCDQAFQEATRMMIRMREQGAVGDGIGPPRRAPFMQACARLPPAARRCIVPSYSMTHPEECRRAREELDPELQREVRGLMNEAF